MEEHASLRPAATDGGTTGREAETTILVLLADPEVRRLGEEIRLEELRLGLHLRARYGALQDRRERAVREGDHAVLQRVCPAKHGQWGRICVLDAGHESADPHWGVNAEGQPVAWVGSAPDDD
ncbi:hypothetical protein K388_05864 [Streptomyces sp. KhCrAH-43]|uniref:hypothetical protein n=1 Tax=unclassified Streptomyces TaxID=2593676 RepID=UPI0003741467|nr:MULTISPECIES: hypothetical protein [unclassified Streptomyces]MYS33533.1 hypothetical protein [Streptomyces sp. SID4920]MYX63875.1 hypothetical protein [Streptomyces sp. SID8373]RAJ52765.1 hypothetical protein K388_05864 [Streptomyces sp. KhCrAH-43]